MFAVATPTSLVSTFDPTSFVFEHTSRVVYTCPLGMRFRGSDDPNERLDTVEYVCEVTGWNGIGASIPVQLNECVCEYLGNTSLSNTFTFIFFSYKAKAKKKVYYK